MSGPLQQRIEKMFKEVKTNPKIEVISSNHKFHPYDERLIEKLENMLAEEYGYRLPDTVRELVNFPAEVSLFWEYKDDDEDGIFGELHLVNIINALSLTSNKVKVYNQDLDENTKSMIQKACFFDAQPSKGWNTATVLISERGRELPELWLLDNSSIHRMDLGIEEYFEELIVTKGIYYWQYLYCDKAAFTAAPYYKKNSIRKIIEVLPSLFPNRNYFGLKHRLERIGG